MKKRTAFYFLFAILILITAGCSNVGKTDDAAFLKTLEEVNTFNALVADNGSFRSTTDYYYDDGTTGFYTIYGDRDLHIVEDDFGTLVIGSGEAYGYDNDTGYYKCLFPGNFSTYSKNFNTLWNMDGEKIVSRNEKKGLISMQTTADDEDNIEYFAYLSGYAAEDIEKAVCDYVIDAKTNEILEHQAYVVIKGEKILVSSMKLKRNVDDQPSYQNISDGLSGTDTWTQTVITDGGTDKEKVYTQTAPKGCRISVYLGVDFEAGRYSDPECTTEIPAPDYTEDCTYYLKRITE